MWYGCVIGRNTRCSARAPGGTSRQRAAGRGADGMYSAAAAREGETRTLADSDTPYGFVVLHTESVHICIYGTIGVGGSGGPAPSAGEVLVCLGSMGCSGRYPGEVQCAGSPGYRRCDRITVACRPGAAPESTPPPHVNGTQQDMSRIPSDKEAGSPAPPKAPPRAGARTKNSIVLCRSYQNAEGSRDMVLWGITRRTHSAICDAGCSAC